MDAAEIKALADAIIARSKADHVEVSISSSDQRWIRFANNGVTTNGDTTNRSVSVTTHFGKRSGTASGNQFGGEDLDALVARAEELAQLAPEDPESMPGLEPQTYDEVPGWQEPSGLEAMANGVGASLEVARDRGLTVAGFARQSSGWTSYTTNLGLFGLHRTGDATVSQTMRTSDGRGSGWSNHAAGRAEDLDYAGVAQRAADKAQRSLDVQPLEPGDYPVILEPACVANMVNLLSWSLSARSADEGRSWIAGKDGSKLGQRVFSESVNLTSDPGSPLARGAAWGEDGLPQAPRTWVKDGVLQTLARGRFWAAESQQEAVPRPPNLLMAGGEKSMEDLIASTERAVLITSLWYIRSVAPQQLLYTGLTRDGVFWVEDGKITHALPNFRWNDSPLQVFSRICLLYTSPSPRDLSTSRMPSSA